MTDICRVLVGQASFRSGGGVDESVIVDAERQLGLRFAKDYREYLATLGTARYYGHELTGLNCARYLDVVAATTEGREIYPDVPSNCYVIEEAQIDGITYWQDASGAVYKVMPNGRPAKCYSSLAQYIKGTAASA